METTFSSVPITALHVCRAGDRDLLLSGQGSDIRVHDCEQRQVLLQKRVFVSNVIHGISTRPASRIAESVTSILILLWAGTATATAILEVVGNNHFEPESVRLTFTQLFVIDHVDWVLFGNFIECDQSDTARAYIVTNHNEIHEVDTVNLATEKRLHGSRKLVSGPSCVLYSAHARSTLKGLLVAAGTVFGEVVVWSANLGEEHGGARILSILLGHKGSIFGVHLSEDIVLGEYRRRLLATCSDDRTIRIWNVNDQERSPEHMKKQTLVPIQLSDATGFHDLKSDARSSLAVVWGHLSRIWTVKFLAATYSGSFSNINLISTGEDASLQLWKASIDSTNDGNELVSARLAVVKSHRLHSGKSIWSSASFSSTGSYIQYTGGADGLIMATNMQKDIRAFNQTSDFHFRMSFLDVFTHIESEKQSKISNNHKDKFSLKQYACTGDGSVIVITGSGSILHAQHNDYQQTIDWTCLTATTSRSATLICNDRSTGSVFFARAGAPLEGLIQGSNKVITSSITVDSQATFMCVALRRGETFNRTRKISILVPLSQQQSATLIIVSMDDILHLSHSVKLSLPIGFIPTSACHHVQKGLLFLGSRSGALAIFDLADMHSANIVTQLKNIHGTDTVTSLMLFDEEEVSSEQSATQATFLLTTGRDGEYAIHKVLPPSDINGKVTMRTVHRSLPPIGPNIEGAYLARSAHGSGQDLVLFGFKSKEFVVWNETQHTEVLSVDCGGAHRSWAYSPMREKPFSDNSQGGVFVWTKAGVCNIYHKPAAEYHVIQNGGHGREIKALAISPTRSMFSNFGIRDDVLVATGAEDTTIRLFLRERILAISSLSSNRNMLNCVAILNKHTTGIHHLSFSDCGTYLLSSGGCEELLVWRLQYGVPIVKIGVVLEGILAKTEMDADARITDFKIIKSSKPDFGRAGSPCRGFRVAATYSNGKAKIFQYLRDHESCEGMFTLLREIVEGSFCLTKLHFTGSTSTSDELLLTAGTNGRINLRLLQDADQVAKYNVHQNSIQASLSVSLCAPHMSQLLITSGDDNALSLTILSRCTTTLDAAKVISKTLLMPNAHAAAITGLAIVLQQTHGEKVVVYFTSVSIDQKVKVWRISLHSPEGSKDDFEMQQLQIHVVAESWTCVADATAAELLPIGSKSGELEYELLIVGVGMEIIRLPPLNPE